MLCFMVQNLQLNQHMKKTYDLRAAKKLDNQVLAGMKEL